MNAPKIIFLLLILVSFNSIAAMTAANSVIFHKPIKLADSNIDAIIAETNNQKFLEKTYDLKVKCHSYKMLKKEDNKKPLHCEIIGAVSDELSEGKVSP
jgi:hypothetical protein